jgi:hypothetical protein
VIPKGGSLGEALPRSVRPIVIVRHLEFLPQASTCLFIIYGTLQATLARRRIETADTHFKKAKKGVGVAQDYKFYSVNSMQMHSN